MPDHDNSYKLLFSHQEMVRDLLVGFVQEPWLAELDFSTLEKVNGSYVSDDLRSREDDVIWRVRFKERWLYLYILLEFQSSVDAYMALRIMTYLGLLYQDILRQGQQPAGQKLPPVLPIVLYNGQPRWTVATDIAQLIEPPPGKLRDYTPQLRYLLLDEGAIDETGPAGAEEPDGGTVQAGEKPRQRQLANHLGGAARLALRARAKLATPGVHRVALPSVQPPAPPGHRTARPQHLVGERNHVG
jgi:hypothetical protein